jgi:hypothetical protein
MSISRPKQTDVARLKKLEEQFELLTEKVNVLGSRCSVIVPITTFAPEPFEPLKEIKTVVEESEDEFIASFYDANVSAEGSNRQEAYDNLKDLLLSRFDYLDKMPPEQLGPALQRQIAVLREFIRRCD